VRCTISAEPCGDYSVSYVTARIVGEMSWDIHEVTSVTVWQSIRGGLRAIVRTQNLDASAWPFSGWQLTVGGASLRNGRVVCVWRISNADIGRRTATLQHWLFWNEICLRHRAFSMMERYSGMSDETFKGVSFACGCGNMRAVVVHGWRVRENSAQICLRRKPAILLQSEDVLVNLNELAAER
jgi:hypothetical protein